jgi:DNA-binding CsgD family transcriptional regulator
MINHLDKLLIITQYLASKPTLEQLTTFLSLNHCPSGEISSVYIAKIVKNESVVIETAHGFQADEFVQIGRHWPLEITRPSGRSILENQILFDEVNSEYYSRYPALGHDEKITYPSSTKVSIPINSLYFMQIGRYCSFTEPDMPFYQNIQSLLQIYFSRIGKVSLGIGDLSGKPLTSRQKVVLDYMKQGLTNEEIAVKIGFSTSLVKQESMLIFSKLGISGRKGLN